MVRCAPWLERAQRRTAGGSSRGPSSSSPRESGPRRSHEVSASSAATWWRSSLLQTAPSFQLHSSQREQNEWTIDAKIHFMTSHLMNFSLFFLLIQLSLIHSTIFINYNRCEDTFFKKPLDKLSSFLFLLIQFLLWFIQQYLSIHFDMVPLALWCQVGPPMLILFNKNEFWIEHNWKVGNQLLCPARKNAKGQCSLVRKPTDDELTRLISNEHNVVSGFFLIWFHPVTVNSKR